MNNTVKTLIDEYLSITGRIPESISVDEYLKFMQTAAIMNISSAQSIAPPITTVKDPPTTKKSDKMPAPIVTMPDNSDRKIEKIEVSKSEKEDKRAALLAAMSAIEG